MKVVILAGGYGTRLSEYTHAIPKPMVPIGDLPILIHIMNLYSDFGFKNFYIALGYKKEIVIDYFDSKKNTNTTKKHEKNKKIYQNIFNGWSVHLVDTGIDTMTGGRLKKLSHELQYDNFMLTYGDGLSNINLHKLAEFHNKNNKITTISAVRPPARFGELEINGDLVLKFKEKHQLNEGWINGGFFVMKPDIFELINDDKMMLERFPLETLATRNELIAYKHQGFWQCMDNKRDKILLEKMLQSNPLWIQKK